MRTRWLFGLLAVAYAILGWYTMPARQLVWSHPSTTWIVTGLTFIVAALCAAVWIRNGAQTAALCAVFSIALHAFRAAEYARVDFPPGVWANVVMALMAGLIWQYALRLARLRGRT